MEILSKLPGSSVYLSALVIFGLGGIAAIIMTCFLKMAVVMLIVKSALGLQEAPPTIAINALALILTMYVMAPVALSSVEIFKQYDIDTDNLNDPKILTAARASAEPLRQFLIKHASETEKLFFVDAAASIWPKEYSRSLSPDHWLVIIPAFTASQLKSAFQTGFLIYLPFIVIDLIVSNILLALGMMMMSPIVVSLPFKLLLFVALDGWSRLLHGLVLSYV